MKKLKGLFMAIAAVMMLSVPAAAQFRIGPRIGTEINSLRFDKSAFDSDNRAGFTGGLQVEFTAPIINLGFDASVMYVHRVSNPKIANMSGDFTKDYIEIPVNLKYKLGLPVVGKIISPYIFTGPSFAFLTSKKAINEFVESKTMDVAWNFGLGIQLFSHLQIGASYGLGMTKALKAVGQLDQSADIEGKNKYWTVTAAWLF